MFFLRFILRKVVEMHFGMLGMWMTSRAHPLPLFGRNEHEGGDEEMAVLLLLKKKERKSL